MNVPSDISRREFILRTSAIIFGGPALIERTAMPTTETVILSDEESRFTPGFLERILQKIRALAENPDKKALRLQFPSTGGDIHSVRIFSSRKDKTKPLHFVMEREDGKMLNLFHQGGNSPFERIHMFSTDRDSLALLKERLRQFWGAVEAKLRGDDPLTIIMKIVAIAIGAWLGIVIGKVVLAALAYIAAFGVVLALALAGAAIVASLIQKRFGAGPHDLPQRTQQLFFEKAGEFPKLVERISE